MSHVALAASMADFGLSGDVIAGMSMIARKKTFPSG